MSEDVSKKEGMMCKLFETGVTWRPAPTVLASYAPDTAPAQTRIDEHGQTVVVVAALPQVSDAIMERLRGDAEKARNDEIRACKKAEPGIFQRMLDNMSLASVQDVQNHQSWAEANRDRDPTKLFLIISMTHRAAGSGCAETLAIDIERMNRQFATLQQLPEESTGEYKKKFDEAVEGRRKAGLAAFTEVELAMKFLTGLDATMHGSMMDDLANAAMRGYAYPQTLASAWTIASTWKTTTMGKSPGGAVERVFVADTREPERRRAQELQTGTGGRSNRRGRRGSDTASATSVPDTASARGRSSGRSQQTAHNRSGGSVTSDITAQSRGQGRQCWICHQDGHISRDCPRNANRDRREMAAIGEEDDDFDENYDFAFMGGMDEERAFFEADDIIFDCATSRSIFHNRDLLSSISAGEPRVVGGISKDAKGVQISEFGDFRSFGRVGIARGASANILGQACQKDLGNVVKYDESNDLYTITSPRETLTFSRRLLPNGQTSRHYVYNRRQAARALATVDEEIARLGLTKREVKRAAYAREMANRMGGAPSAAAAQTLTRAIGVDVTNQDLQRADIIYGKSMMGIKGHTVKRASMQAQVELVPRSVRQEQTLSVDIMFIKQIPFLVGLFSPLDLLMVKHLSSRATANVASGLHDFMAAAESRSFTVPLLKSDNEGAVAAHAQALAREHQMEVTLAGPGQHVPEIERAIRTIKERVRGHEEVLPWTMTRLLLVHCVSFCVSGLNMQVSATAADNIPPIVKFTGRQIRAADLRVKFGDYVQALVPDPDNSMRARTDGCITLVHTGNLTGSVKMLALATGKIVVRDQFTILPTPQLVINHINQKALAEGMQRGRDDPGVSADVIPADSGEEPGSGVSNGDGAVQEVHRVAAEAATGEHGAATEEQAVAEPEAPTEPDLSTEPDPVLLRRSKRVQELEPEFVALMVDDEANADRLGAPPSYSEFAFKTTVREALREQPEEAAAVIKAELQQIVDKKVWHGVRTDTLTQDEKRAILPSSMFLKQKFTAAGELDKYKARLVAGGHRQDKSLYEDLASPTASLCSVFTTAAIAAQESRKVMTCDIGGAFLHCPIAPTGVTVRMALDKVMTRFLLEIAPEYSKFVRPDGTCIVELDRALYGTVEAAKLWYDNVSATLTADGYVMNPYDFCVFNKVGADGHQTTIVLHVDDMMASCRVDGGLVDLVRILTKKYKEVTVKRGRVLDFLGMVFDFSTDGQVSVTMPKYIDDLIKEAGVTVGRATPATSQLFEVRDAPKATPEEQNYFHKYVAKVLYLAKRSLPEALTAVAFLTTRVKDCDIDDLSKLRRLLGYVLTARDRGITLRIGATMEVRAYIDAAYGVHTKSGKSHTGCAISLGEGGPVFVKSAKQKIVTKSSTEAELVALSDSVSQAIHLRHFLMAQGYRTPAVQVPPVRVYQDNLSTMALVARGGPASERSRHIDIRQFWVAERVKKGEVVIEHLGTELMHANLLTKPVQGKQFLEERAGLTHWA